MPQSNNEDLSNNVPENNEAEDTAKVKELRARYLVAAHAMQSGVKYDMDTGMTNDTTPKHLRVGINSSLVDNSALVTLLVQKGVITKEEYFEALVMGMEAEVERYEFELSRHLGVQVHLA